MFVRLVWKGEALCLPFFLRGCGKAKSSPFLLNDLYSSDFGLWTLDLALSFPMGNDNAFLPVPESRGLVSPYVLYQRVEDPLAFESGYGAR